MECINIRSERRQIGYLGMFNRKHPDHAIQQTDVSGSENRFLPHFILSPSPIRTITVGTGIPPVQFLFNRKSRAVTAGREFHHSPKAFIMYEANPVSSSRIDSAALVSE